MRSRADGVAGLAVAHLAAFAAASVYGAFSGASVRHGAMSGRLWDVVTGIAASNLIAMTVLLVCGIVLFGMAGIFVFAVNGYAFGHALVASDVPVFWVWMYAPLELSAFALGGAVSASMGFEIVSWLGGGVVFEAHRAVQWALAVGVAVAGLAIAALFEGIAIQLARGG